MSKLIPLVLVVVGILSGGAAGYVFRPPPVTVDAAEDGKDGMAKPSKDPDAAYSPSAFVKLNNQFIVPIVTDTFVSGLVVVSLTLETSPDDTNTLYNIEPKIRDVALRVLFDHAFIGGFDGKFTSPSKMAALRKGLLAEINVIADGTVKDVLITDIIRQDS